MILRKCYVENTAKNIIPQIKKKNVVEVVVKDSFHNEDNKKRNCNF